MNQLIKFVTVLFFMGFFVHTGSAVMHREGGYPDPHRSMPQVPVSVEVLNLQFSAHFLTECGSVTISIVGENGNVQIEYFLIDSPQTVSFPLNGFAMGEECRVEVISETYHLGGTVIIE